MNEIKKIALPKGCFEGNCSDCVYANHHDKDIQGRVKCQGKFGGYNKPEYRNGCVYYSSGIHIEQDELTGNLMLFRPSEAWDRYMITRR